MTCGLRRLPVIEDEPAGVLVTSETLLRGDVLAEFHFTWIHSLNFVQIMYENDEFLCFVLWNIVNAYHVFSC